MQQIVEEEKRKVQESENTIKVLKDTMTEMDEQLQVMTFGPSFFCHVWLVV